MLYSGGENDTRSGPRPKPVHPREAEQLQQMREADEVGRLMAANMYPQQKNVTPLRQPRVKVRFFLREKTEKPISCMLHRFILHPNHFFRQFK